MGLNPKKLQVDLKNYLEKVQKSPPQRDPAMAGQVGSIEESFSDDFQKTIESALKISADRQHLVIGEKEILIALAKTDDFF